MSCELFSGHCPSVVNLVGMWGVIASFGSLLFGVLLETFVNFLGRYWNSWFINSTCLKYPDRLNYSDDSLLHTQFKMLFRFPIKGNSRYILIADGGHFEN